MCHLNSKAEKIFRHACHSNFLKYMNKECSMKVKKALSLESSTAAVFSTFETERERERKKYFTPMKQNVNLNSF